MRPREPSSSGAFAASTRSPEVRLPWPALDWTHPLHPLGAAAAHYLRGVRRLATGATVTVFDGDGREGLATLTALADGSPALMLSGPPTVGRRGAAARLAYALPKGDKLEDVLRQVTELGVGGLVLFVAQRSVSRPDDGDRLGRKRDRWQRILEEAARQSGRADLPSLFGPMSLSDALAETAVDSTRVLLHPEAELRFADIPLGAPATVFVGPEGGFSPAELALCSTAGVTAARLDTPVLRTETAAVVGVALTLHRLGAT